MAFRPFIEEASVLLESANQNLLIFLGGIYAYLNKFLKNYIESDILSIFKIKVKFKIDTSLTSIEKQMKKIIDRKDPEFALKNVTGDEIKNRKSINNLYIIEKKLTLSMHSHTSIRKQNISKDNEWKNEHSNKNVWKKRKFS